MWRILGVPTIPAANLPPRHPLRAPRAFAVSRPLHATTLREWALKTLRESTGLCDVGDIFRFPANNETVVSIRISKGCGSRVQRGLSPIILAAITRSFSHRGGVLAASRGRQKRWAY